MQDRFQQILYQHPVSETDMFDMDDDINKAYDNIDDLDEFEAYCKQVPKIPLHETTEIYRSMGWDEIIALIEGNTLENKNGLVGFAFALEKHLGNYVTTNYQTEGFLVTFDSNIMQDNFRFVEFQPDVNWFEENARIAFNLTGYDVNLKFGEFNQILNTIEFDECWDVNRDLPNKEFKKLTSKFFCQTHTNYECFIKLLHDKNEYVCRRLLTTAILNECLLVGSYWFVPGMITNIQTTTKGNIEKLYNFILKNQDKLNLQL
jgi:hypothetical protein